MADRPWKVPSRDGEVLVWPDATRWAELALAHHARMAQRPADGPRLLGVPRAVLRRSARAALPTFVGPTADPDAPWIVTGHQTVPFHPGVWAKLVATDACARRVGGAAVHVHVDHDVPSGGRQLAWPARGPDGRPVRRGALALDDREPFERQPPPAPAALAALGRRLDDDLAALLSAPRDRPFALRPPTASASFATWCAAARADLDRDLGLALTETLGSALADTDAFLLFVADALSPPGRMHHAYNAALAAAAPASSQAPARALRAVDDALELPFWTLRAGVPGRHRLWVRATPGALALTDDQGALGSLAAADLGTADRAVPALRRLLAGAGAVVRPRAITLTLFHRLVLADLFVHGTGGAAYDAATDRLFRPLYGLDAPPFAVASATLRLPIDAPTASLADVCDARRWLRDARFNPERCLRADASPEAAALRAAKSAAVARDVVRQAHPHPDRAGRRAEKARSVAAIEAVNRELRAWIAGDVGARRLTLDHLEALRPGSDVALARDYFYGLFPRDRLESLRASIAARFALTR